jgi:hypothetical protein
MRRGAVVVIGVVSVVVTGGAIAVVALNADHVEHLQRRLFPVASAGFLLAAAVATAATLWLTVRAVGGAVRGLRMLKPLFGETATDRLIGILVPLPFFATTLGDAALRAIRFALLLTTLVPQHFERVWFQSSDICHNHQISDCFSTLGFGFMRVTIAVDEAATRSLLSSLPIGSLFLFVLLASACGHFTGVIRSSIDAERERGTPPAAFVGARKNLMLASLMILGGFFVMASVVAIPIMDTGTPIEPADVAGFEKRVDDLALVEQQLDRDFPAHVFQTTATAPDAPPAETRHEDPAGASSAVERTSGTSLAALDAHLDAGVTSAHDAGLVAQVETFSLAGMPASPKRAGKHVALAPLPSAAERDAGALATVDAAKGTTIMPPLRVSIDPQRWFERMIESQRAEAQKEWTETRNDVWRQLPGIQRTMMNEFRICDVNLKTKREKLEYASMLESWAARRLGDLKEALNQCRESMRQRETLYKAFFDSYKSMDLGGSAAPNAPKLPDLELRCTVPVEYFPATAQRGGELGPFGFIARWLVQTDSVALALITGLLGCGLLGSVVSTFLRKRIMTAGLAVAAEEGSAFHDLLSVVVRGVSAAFVVFLAAKGGLAIVASNGTQPNPYVLLLACLLGAVFSERVWSWAERKILGDLLNDGQGRERRDTDDVGNDGSSASRVPVAPTADAESGEKKGDSGESS